MESKKILELTEKLGMNKEAMENLIKKDKSEAEKMVTKLAKFKGVK